MANAVTELLKNHRSIRRFSDRTIADALLEELVACAQQAATSSFVQAYSIIHVSDPAKKAALRAVTGQSWVEENAALLVFVADYYRHQIIEAQGDVSMTPGFVTTEALLVATIDATLAAENLAVAAESEGLGICFIGSLRNDLKRVIEILALPRFTYPVFGMVLGYPAGESEGKPRLLRAEVLHQDSYHSDPERIMQHLRDYDRTIHDYYSTRAGGTRTTNWSAQMREKFSRPSREDVDAVLKKQGFLQQ